MSKVNLPGGDKVCPFMSGRPLAVNMPQVVELPGAQGVTTMMVSCLKEKCELWGQNTCSLREGLLTEVMGNIAVGLTDVSRGLEPLRQPSTGSPTTHLTNTIEKLVKVLDKIDDKRNPF